ncbi:MAG: vWA domain-containing protein [Hyphomicrobiales bacterium]
MKRPRLKALTFILGLIVITGAAMAYSGRVKPADPQPPLPPPIVSSGAGILNLAGHMVQTHVLKGSPGKVSLELTLSAGPGGDGSAAGEAGIDFVVVLDRSGSMQGPKLEYARQSLRSLIAGLTERDRFALFSYSDAVQKHCDLLAATDLNRGLMQSAVNGIFSSGATNLGEGLRAGIDMITASGRPGHPGRVILISDGLANRGMTDPAALGRMAALAAGKEFAVSTVGVGADFNEFLMSMIADRGAGSYYYLDNPSAFAEMFQKEFLSAKSALATGIAVSLALPAGVRLLDAAGYPVSLEGDWAVFYPGSLRSGQTRRVFLTLQVPTDQERRFQIGRVKARYQYQGQLHEAVMESTLTVACVGDEGRVLSSIDRTRWEHKVLSDDYNRLKQDVAADISSGKREEALKRIETYEAEQRTLNSVVRSPEVGLNLEKDVKELKKRVDETFQGSPATVMEKQKAASKSLQYEGYSDRRK